jgi:hypothetical protein
MKAQATLGTVVLGLLALALGCGGTMHTGTAKRPTNNKPAADGSCPTGQTPCGTGAFVVCVDLQDDSDHCGVCDRACAAGIACQAGVCQQTVCTGSTIPLSGQPTTTAPSPTISPTQGHALLADVNGDGRQDLVVWVDGYVDLDTSTFRVSLGQEGGGFGAEETYQASATVTQILVMDVNADRADDLLVFTQMHLQAVTQPFRVELWLGSPDGRLARSDTAGVTGESVTGMMAIADLSGDGWPDLVIQKPDLDSTHPGSIDVYLSDSIGALHLSKSYGTGWGSVFQTIIRDWNGDGSPDLALINDGVQILYNRGDGTFAPLVNCGLALGLWAGQGFVVEDFNRDGWMDLALPYSRSRIGVMLGTGGCGFSPIDYYAVPGSEAGVVRAADMNGDGILDLVSVSLVTGPDATTPSVVVTQDHLLTVLLGRGDGTFELQGAPISLGPDVSDVTIGEVSGDQRPDVVVATSDGQNHTWENGCQ